MGGVAGAALVDVASPGEAVDAGPIGAVAGEFSESETLGVGAGDAGVVSETAPGPGAPISEGERLAPVGFDGAAAGGAGGVGSGMLAPAALSASGAAAPGTFDGGAPTPEGGARWVGLRIGRRVGRRAGRREGDGDGRWMATGVSEKLTNASGAGDEQAAIVSARSNPRPAARMKRLARFARAREGEEGAAIERTTPICAGPSAFQGV